MHAHLVWKGEVVSVSMPPRPDLSVRSQSSVVMVYMLQISKVMYHG